MSKRILLLEDEEKILELIQEILEAEGYNVIAFKHYESVEDIIEFAPGLILLDIRLSDGYGHLLCEDLKSNPKTTHIPVILVSGADNLEKIAQDYKADNYLSKPFSVDELVKMVKQYD
ncbi:MAG: phoB 4 [Mucilaginibacter sp.]|nr:phoB 4 [Mucilaginibacter sp.]